MWWWLWLACSGAPVAEPPVPDEAPTAAEAPAPGTPVPDLDTLARWLEADGTTPERFEDVLRVAHEGEHGVVGITVQTFDDPPVVYLQTTPLTTLADASGERGVVLLLTQLAVLNYETVQGKLQLNPRTGEVLASVELESDAGVAPETFRAAMAGLAAQADAWRPVLAEAANGVRL